MNVLSSKAISDIKVNHDAENPHNNLTLMLIESPLVQDAMLASDGKQVNASNGMENGIVINNSNAR